MAADIRFWEQHQSIFVSIAAIGQQYASLRHQERGGEQFVETGQLATDQWVHIAVTLGDGAGKLYVNGELKAEKNNMTIKPSDFKPSNNYIGRSQFADPLFTGKIDDFRVYDSVLSSEEIQAVYNKTSTWFDDSLLALLLNKASKVDAECCTPESYEVLEVAMAHANTVASAGDSNQEDVDVASTDLLAALEGLQRKGVDVTADPTEPNGSNGWYTSPVILTLKPVRARSTAWMEETHGWPTRSRLF